jgi:cytochrome d ubiquinol oxidase subunit II
MMFELNTLQNVWIILIAVLWVGYFVLEGFDFGVGILLPVIGKNEAEKRTLMTTLGPLWDGNEVWLLVAGGATFAAFPEWYATLFSGFYLPLFLILVALIIRGVAFEYRSKHGDVMWRSRWDKAIVVGSFIPALLWGVAFANLARGVEIEVLSSGGFVYTGGFFALLNPFALLGGLVTLTLFMTHGAIFISLKTDGEIRYRARKIALQLGLVATVLAVTFLLWGQLAYSNNTWTWIPVGIAAVSWLVGLFAMAKGREGFSFTASALTLAMAVATIIGWMYPNVMPHIDRSQTGLTIYNASSTEMTLKIMTIVALVMTPIVLLYQGWTYWVFRKRLTSDMIPNPERGSLDEVHI